mmetsp:Transcript_73672/g.213414  ORF Transcript_73672/g.213414 Transcript_73672/m.213414 type:complete len:100 (+) Transcript_73672:1093-1392(+)
MRCGLCLKGRIVPAYGKEEGVCTPKAAPPNPFDFDFELATFFFFLFIIRGEVKPLYLRAVTGPVNAVTTWVETTTSTIPSIAILVGMLLFVVILSKRIS